MNIGFVLYLAAPNTAFKRAAIPHLKQQFPGEWAQIWRSTRDWQSRLAPGRPRHSAMVNILMRQMEWNCALYRALKDHGLSHDEAGALVETVGLDVYRPLPAAWFQLSRLRSAKHDTRVKWLFGLMTRYFFAPPFIHRHLPPKPGEVVAFDVTLCPLADYFKDQGVPELTPYAACRLDLAAAHAYGVDLVRTQTIAEGAEHCDFRWKLPATEGDRASGA